MPSRRGNEFGDVTPRAFGQQNSKVNANTDTIGLREHLRFMMEHPERFGGSEDITIELPTTEYLQVLVAAIANDDSISTWVVEAVRQRLVNADEML